MLYISACFVNSLVFKTMLINDKDGLTANLIKLRLQSFLCQQMYRHAQSKFGDSNQSVETSHTLHYCWFGFEKKKNTLICIILAFLLSESDPQRHYMVTLQNSKVMTVNYRKVILFTCSYLKKHFVHNYFVILRIIISCNYNLKPWYRLIGTLDDLFTHYI